MSMVSKRFLNERRWRNEIEEDREKYGVPKDFDLNQLNYEELEEIVNSGSAKLLINYYEND